MLGLQLFLLKEGWYMYISLIPEMFWYLSDRKISQVLKPQEILFGIFQSIMTGVSAAMSN